MKSGLGSEGHHAHGHITQPRIFQEYLPGAAERVQWLTEYNNKCLNISRCSIKL